MNRLHPVSVRSRESANELLLSSYGLHRADVLRMVLRDLNARCRKRVLVVHKELARSLRLGGVKLGQEAIEPIEIPFPAANPAAALF